MILGTLLASQSMDQYFRSLKYFDEAEKIQKDVIQSKEKVLHGNPLGNKITKDQLILAFR